jgi:hypothetical protein
MRTTRKTAILGLVLVLAALVGAGVLTAQSQTAGHQAEHQQAGHPELEVFCSHLSAGQLCLAGTPNVLKLEGTKKEQWVAAAMEYNKAVNGSTKQLLAHAKTILSPQEYATVEKWFDHGLNEVLNTVLIGDQAKTSHK